MLIAIAVIVQLASSLIMKAHPQDGTEDVFFEVHEYSGLISFAVICASSKFTKLNFVIACINSECCH